jgi:VanZ family protein
MVAIFTFSTDTFSSAHTSGIFEPLLKFVFPSLTVTQLNFWHGVIRKAGHVTEYFILGFFAWRTFRAYIQTTVTLKLLIAAFVLMFALSDEFHQSFVASRTSSLFDVGYDFVGCLIVLMLLPGSRNEHRTLHSHTVL